MQKKIAFLLLVTILITSTSSIFAQDTPPKSKFSITAYAGGGVRIALSDNLFGAVGGGIGAKYHFCDHWSLNFGWIISILIMVRSADTIFFKCPYKWNTN